MTSIIKLQPLSGACDESPHCYLLQVDEFRFLLDCGWDEFFSTGFIKELKKVVGQIDAVLLSFPDALHLGALPYAVGKLGLQCPIYATIPVYKMGQMFMYDLFQSHHNTEDFDLFTLDDIDAAFDKIIQLKYNQSTTLKGKGMGLTITPHPAGHMLGGTIWRIVKDGEEDIVYAVDYNHKKERHLNGCVLDTFIRPSILITDAFNISYNQSRRRLRDEQLMTNILQTLRGGGNVLVAVDTAGRVLELAHMVDQLWRNQDSGLMAYSLALLNNVSYNVVEFAKSQVEWMSDKIMRSFEGQRNNPFQFKHLKQCHSLAELAKVPDPKVVLASTPDLESGFSRDLFIQWCSSAKNSVILTNRSSPGTLARQIMDNPNDKTITLQIRRRMRLEGFELEEHIKREKEKEAEAARQKAEKAIEDADSSEESDDELNIDFVLGSKAKHDLMMSSEGKARGGFFKQAKKSYPMFPSREERIKWDEYGEIIKPEDYIIAEVNPSEEDNKEKIEDNNEEMQDISEVPTKCVSTIQTLDLNAQVQFIDFEGRSDGESIRKLISQMKPRRVVILRGAEDSIVTLTEYCKSLSDIDKVFVPKLFEIVDATTESHIYQVRLKDSLVSSLLFARAKDAELAWVDGEIVMEMPITADVVPPNEEPMEEDDEDGIPRGLLSSPNKMAVALREQQLVPTLEPLPASQVESHATVFVNELKLSDFKQVLMKAGITAEFSGGILYCNNGQVAVRRNETGRINLEGCVCEDYYLVRDLLYEQYAII